MTDVSGWNVYGRAAPFADCKRFPHPRRTRFMCERTPAEMRPASLFYLWFDGSPGRGRGTGIRRSETPRSGSGARGDPPPAARRYLADVVSQLPRFVDPGAYHRPSAAAARSRSRAVTRRPSGSSRSRCTATTTRRTCRGRRRRPGRRVAGHRKAARRRHACGAGPSSRCSERCWGAGSRAGVRCCSQRPAAARGRSCRRPPSR